MTAESFFSFSVAAVYDCRICFSHSWLQTPPRHQTRLCRVPEQIGKAHFFEVGIGCSHFADSEFSHASK